MSATAGVCCCACYQQQGPSSLYHKLHSSAALVAVSATTGVCSLQLRAQAALVAPDMALHHGLCVEALHVAMLMF